MSKLFSFVSWCLANKAQIALGFAVLSTATSAFLKALTGLLAIFEPVFPWLSGPVNWIVNHPLPNLIALNPKPRLASVTKLPSSVGPVVGVLLVLAALALPSQARADNLSDSTCQILNVSARHAQESIDLVCPRSDAPIKDSVGTVGALDWSIGPTLPFLEYDFGNPHPVQVAPGAGIQLSVTLNSLKRAFLGKSWDLIDLQLSAFGSVVSSSTGQQFGAFSASGGLGFFSSLFSLGLGKHILSADQSFTHGGGFVSLALNLNVALSLTAPPAGVVAGPVGMPRANTLYLGAL